MDNTTRRAAQIAANKLLAAAGYNIKGLSMQAAAKRKRARLIAEGKITPRKKRQKNGRS